MRAGRWVSHDGAFKLPSLQLRRAAGLTISERLLNQFVVSSGSGVPLDRNVEALFGKLIEPFPQARKFVGRSSPDGDFDFFEF
jgi:hypothetical protein